MYEETDKLDEALEDFKKVLTFDPNHTEANHAVRVMYHLLKTYIYIYLKSQLLMQSINISIILLSEATSIN